MGSFVTNISKSRFVSGYAVQHAFDQRFRNLYGRKDLLQAHEFHLSRHPQNGQGPKTILRREFKNNSNYTSMMINLKVYLSFLPYLTLVTSIR